MNEMLACASFVHGLCTKSFIHGLYSKQSVLRIRVYYRPVVEYAHGFCAQRLAVLWWLLLGLCAQSETCCHYCCSLEYHQATPQTQHSVITSADSDIVHRSHGSRSSQTWPPPSLSGITRAAASSLKRLMQSQFLKIPMRHAMMPMGLQY